VDLVRSLSADEGIDYKKQEFDEVLRDYAAMLATVRGDVLEKPLRILKPGMHPDGDQLAAIGELLSSVRLA
jgi:NADPH:quinone reductase-like Zn-dependent oxidoreductase